MLAEMSSPFFTFDWIKTTWYYQSALKAREKRRNKFAITQEKNESEETVDLNEKENENHNDEQLNL